MVTDQSCYVFQSLDVIGHGSCIQFPQSPQTLELCCLLVSSDKPMGHLTKINNQKRGLTNKEKGAAKKQKVKTLEVKFEWSVKRAVDCRDWRNPRQAAGGAW